MPAVLRQDGESFAVYTYREFISMKKTSLLKKEIQFLKEEHGEYARFYWQEGGGIEAVFSRDAGYLLAESVWQYFKGPQDLLYCEQLEGKKTALLVVIRDNLVYLDEEVSLENLVNELETLTMGEHQYDVYIYGGVPISDTPGGGDEVFAFNKEKIRSFNILKESAFLKLPLNPDFLLLPVDQAIADLKLKEPSVIPFIVGAVALGVVAYLGYQELNPPPPVPKAPAVVNPYAGYEQALMSPSPQDVMSQVSDSIRLLYTVPGWVPKQMTYSHGSLSVRLVSELNASGDLLLHWIKRYNMSLGVEENGATLNIQFNLPPRPQPKVLYQLKEVLSLLFDETHLIFPGSTISFTQPSVQGVYSSTDLNITFNGASALVLDLYGKLLGDKPVVINTMTLNVDSGLLSGQMQLTLLGA